MMLFFRPTPYITSGYASSRPSRAGVVGTVAVHALLVGGYFLMPAELIKEIMPTPIWATNIPLDPPPPENPVEKQAVEKPLQRPVDTRPFVPDTLVDIEPLTDTGIGGAIPNAVDGDIIKPFDPGVVDPPRDPVLTTVSIDPRYTRDFQPDYPPAMQRAQEEGKVTVRVNIGADGRVTSIEKLFATSDAFWEAARKQALAKWRFRAATRDGVPIESEKVMTVHFTLT